MFQMYSHRFCTHIQAHIKDILELILQINGTYIANILAQKLKHIDTDSTNTLEHLMAQITKRSDTQNYLKMIQQCLLVKHLIELCT